MDQRIDGLIAYLALLRKDADMPVVVTFDVKGAEGSEHNRIQSFFERFGWESLGGIASRYPPLGSVETVEDWFNRVIPALMLSRLYFLGAKKSERKLTKFTLDIQSSAGFNVETRYATPPQEGDRIELKTPKYTHFGENNLRQWLLSMEYPYSLD